MSETNTTDDGGPAFPHSPVLDQNGGMDSYWTQHPAPGMSLRDYFAGQALAGLATLDTTDTWIVGRAYKIADAMLRAREEATK